MESDDVSIIHHVPPPELHVMIGVVTHLYKLLEKELPEIAERWLNQCQVKMFHGSSQFNGNSARELLKKTHILDSLKPG